MGSVFSGVGNAIGSLGGETNGISQGFTPQNSFHANTYINSDALNNQMAQSQKNFGQGQNQQQALAQALLAQSQGQGPNPAQAQLNQATNQNIAQNTGMIASQKGINPALAARMASQNAAAQNQQAAGQAATMNANQQLAAQQGLGNLYGQMANQNLQNVSNSGQLINQATLGAQGINAGVAAQNAAAVQNTNSGLLNGIGSGFGMLSSGGGGGAGGGKAHGGMIQPLADGGPVQSNGQQPQQAQQGFFSGSTASSDIAKGILQAGGVPYWANGVNVHPQISNGNPMSSMMSNGPMGAMGGGGDAAGGDSLMSGGGGGASMMMAAAHGGQIPAHMHHVAKIYHPNFQAPRTQSLKAKGGGVPGKAEVKGDSSKNDTVPTMLSPGEMVIPRSVMQAKDPAQAAHDFVASKLKEKGKYSGDSKAEFHDALKKAIGSRKGK